ncbi:MAG: hypothetical protein A2017_17995 [Lentisphaerae bacterium GWF2_44_16]|nr:MAG: hypothetical protein A2017_17995 [Lentisphaerae bacterium GWF2_44_16]
MPMTLAEIEKEAFELNREEQLRLAQDIFVKQPVSEIEQAWYEEAARRLKDIEEGRVKTISAGEVFAEASTRLKKMRKQK